MIQGQIKKVALEADEYFSKNPEVKQDWDSKSILLYSFYNIFLILSSFNAQIFIKTIYIYENCY